MAEFKATSIHRLFALASSGNYEELLSTLEQASVDTPWISVATEPVNDASAASAGDSSPMCRQLPESTGNTILHIIAQNAVSAPFAVLDRLVDLGCDLSWRNQFGQTPRDVAEQVGCTEAVEHLRSLEEQLFTRPTAALFPLSPADVIMSPAVDLSEATEEPSSSAANRDHISICIGDLHGMIGHLEGLWEKLKADVPPAQWSTAYVFWLGDYVDKGSNSSDVIEFLSTIETRSPPGMKHFFVAGNHDFGMQMFLGLLPPGATQDLSGTRKNNRWNEKLYNGPGCDTMHLQGLRWGSDYCPYTSVTTFESYDVDYKDRAGFLHAMPEHHKEFIRNLPWVVDVETPAGIRIIATHAGLAPPSYGTLEEQLDTLRRQDFNIARPMWLCEREIMLATCPEHLISDPGECKRTFFISGHHHTLCYVGTPLSNRIVIDSAAGYFRNSLSCVILPSHQLVSFPDDLSTRLVTPGTVLRMLTK